MWLLPFTPVTATQRVVMIGSALAIGAVSGALLRRWHARAQRQHDQEHLRDNSLQGTFPASDPPASQNFDIPSNRQGVLSSPSESTDN